MKLILISTKIEHPSLCGKDALLIYFSFKILVNNLFNDSFVAFPSSNKQNLL